MSRALHRPPVLIAGLLLFGAAAPASGQYRRQVEELAPAFAASVSAGALFSYEETTTPVPTPEPDAERRGRRSIGTVPAVSVSARYGRGLAVYGSATAAFGAEAELSGFEAITGAPLTGTEDVGMITILSAGMSFAPLRDVMGLRLEIGPAWLDLGEGGSYLGIRIAAAARFLEIGNRGGVVLGWDGYFAGGQHDRDEVEYQVKGGLISGVRLGYEVRY